MHLLLDFMWQTPQTLFWPFMGVSFPPYTTTCNWFLVLFQVLIDVPVVFIPEIIGLGITAGFAFHVFRRKRIADFLFRGRY